MHILSQKMPSGDTGLIDEADANGDEAPPTESIAIRLLRPVFWLYRGLISPFLGAG